MSEAFPPPAELVPHRGPSLLLRRLVEHPEDGVLVAVAAVGADHPAVRGGRCSSLLALEMAAQAAAALECLERRRGDGPTAPRAGYLVALRDVEIARPELVAEVELRVTVRREAAVPPLARYRAEVERAGELRVRGVLSTWGPAEGPRAGAATGGDRRAGAGP